MRTRQEIIKSLQEEQRKTVNKENIGIWEATIRGAMTQDIILEVLLDIREEITRNQRVVYNIVNQGLSEDAINVMRKSMKITLSEKDKEE